MLAYTQFEYGLLDPTKGRLLLAWRREDEQSEDI